MIEKNNRIIGLREVGQALGLSLDGVRARLKYDRLEGLPLVKDGRKWITTQNDLDEYITKTMAKGTKNIEV